MPNIFNFCAVCDDVRLELLNKSSLVGLYGMLPYVEIIVPHPEQPIEKLVFMFMSGTAVPAARYRFRLSVKGPSGKELIPVPQPETVMDAKAAPVNVVLGCVPFQLAGAGMYRISVIVNEREDLSER
jgi:hypothetical protein